MKLIDKDALVVEIERRKNICQGVAHANEDNEFTHLYYNGKTEAYSEMLDFLDTLETKEVDDEPGCKIFPRPIECYSNCKECPWLATNNKAQKGENI